MPTHAGGGLHVVLADCKSLISFGTAFTNACFALGPCLVRDVDPRRYWHQIATFSSHIAQRILLGADTDLISASCSASNVQYGGVTVRVALAREAVQVPVRRRPIHDLHSQHCFPSSDDIEAIEISTAKQSDPFFTATSTHVAWLAGQS